MAEFDRSRVLERAVEVVASHEFPWCRARLLHALAGAAEQGVLAEVMDELLGDRARPITGRAITARLIDALCATGWMDLTVWERNHG